MAGEMYERIEKLEVARDKMLDYDLILHRIESIVGKPLGGRKELPTLVKAWVDRSSEFEHLQGVHKQILTRIGMLTGCEHLDDRLVASVQNAIKASVDWKELIATLGWSGTSGPTGPRSKKGGTCQFIRG